MPFWRALLGYRDREPEDLIDPRGRGPAFWFQEMDASFVTERSFERTRIGS